MDKIKVKDLADTSTITNNNQLMVLTDDSNNTVKNITVNDLLSNIISDDAENVLEQGTDGKLYVETPETIIGDLNDLNTIDKSSLVEAINEVNADTGVISDTYEYVKNLQVDEKGKIISVEQGQEAFVPVATSSLPGICKPDNKTVFIDEIGNLSSKNNYYYSFNNGEIDSSGNPDLIDATISQDTEYTVAGTYTINIQTAGYYPIALVGGGGGAWSGLNSLGYGSYCGGGSGAAFVGEVYLNVGEHQIVVGAIDNTYNVGNSILYDENGNALITAGGGTKGAGTNYNLSKSGGYGGTLTIADGVQTQNVTVQTNGLDGGFNNGNQAVAGGASVYGGYGTGANSPADNNSTSGYFSIVLPSASSNISYKVGGSYPALTGTLADGKQFTLNGLNSDDITGLADGSYVKYVGSDGSSELLKANLTVAKTVPSTPADNDVWVNNSVSPLSVKKYVAPNYTVVGTPTITDDGIASGFYSGKYIYQNLGITYDISSHAYTLKARIIDEGTVAGSYVLDFGNTAYLLIYNRGSNSATLSLQMKNSSQTNTTSITTNSFSVNVDDIIDVTLELMSDKQKLSYSINNGTVTSNEGTVSPSLTTISNVKLSIGAIASTSWYYSRVPIDLKEVKVYVDDTLVYQPNIPNGWQDYNKVPVGKITLSSGGITGVKTFPYNIDYVENNIIETYQNGSDWYRVYADGFCIQGSAETISASYSQTAKKRDLLKPFKNTDYTVLVTPNTTLSSQFDNQYFTVKEKTTSDFTTFFDISCSWVAYGYTNIF